MKKFTMLLIPMLLLCGIVQAAEDTDKASIWTKMRSKIEQVTPKKKVVSETVVGGVRGAQGEGSSDLYWKGENVKITAAPEELEAFQQALKLADQGEKTAAREAFGKFISTYPHSELLADARQAMHLLSATE
jgi:TolA-binding protein